MSDDALFRVEGLCKYFTGEASLLDRLLGGTEPAAIRAVDGVDLSIKEGETLGLVGESGCGKSTLARAVLRLIEPTDGHVWYDGREVTAFDEAELRAFRSDVQMIFQDPYASLNPRYTVSRTLREPMRVHGIGDSRADRTERAGDLLERVGLSADQLGRYPHEFSGGQRQRIALARALAVEPRLIVADEPVSALDVSVQARILTLLRDLQEEMGLTMLFISHDLSIVRRISDRFAVMYLGEIVESGDTDALFEDPKHPYTRALLSSIPIPDPTHEGERILLHGDVPKPDDPPAGCRFHPRCQSVIPPADWPDDQATFRQYVQVRNRIESGDVEPEVTREKLSDRRGREIRDEELVERLYDEHVERDAVGEEPISPSEPVRDALRTALARVVDGDPGEAVAALDGAYRTVCAAATPKTVLLDDGRDVHCHLHDPEVADRPTNELPSSSSDD